MGVIKVPREYLSDFIGTIVIDILHDAKGRGILVGHKLADITDLISFTIAQESEGTHTKELRNEIFHYALRYMCDIWSSNIRALGINEAPEIPSEFTSSEWDYLRAIITLPIRTVAERPDEDSFAGLGCNTVLSVESSNYAYQKDLLVDANRTELISFVSPRGINDPGDYFLQAAGIVDIIKTRTTGKIVLDMKSAAGLIRTITDPIGYITGLPTFADPGYNMPGMSAIRKYAAVEFLTAGVDSDTLEYRGAQEYMYTIHLDLQTFPSATMLHVEYFYGVRSGGLQRDNVCVSILNHPFSGTLPRSSVMAESLREYLKGTEETLTLSCSELLNGLVRIIVGAYSEHLPIPAPPSADLNRFTHELILLERRYDVSFEGGYTPEELISTQLPALIGSGFFNEYCAVTHAINLIKSTHSSNDELLQSLQAQWLPKRKGKLITQVERAATLFNKECGSACREHKSYLQGYFNSLTQRCVQSLGDLWRCIHNEIPDNVILQVLPLFEPPNSLGYVLDKYTQIHYPALHALGANVPRGGLRLLSALRLVISGIHKYPISLDTIFTHSERIAPNHQILETAQVVWGKFTGDFGQILWAMEHGHLFASEDNNTSAMALLLHRICGAHNSKAWGNIHGLGDGGSVDITLSAPRQK